MMTPTSPRGGMMEPREHRLKTWPQFFAAIRAGWKPFEVRWDDRGYAVGDTLILQEYHPHGALYTGEEERRIISYVMSGGHFGIAPGYVVLGLAASPLRRDAKRAAQPTQARGKGRRR